MILVTLMFREYFSLVFSGSVVQHLAKFNNTTLAFQLG